MTSGGPSRSTNAACMISTVGGLAQVSSKAGGRRRRLRGMTSPLFEVRVSVPVAAAPAQVYDVVSDLPRSGEWSAERQGGTWVQGAPAAVGAVFRGVNYRAEDVVSWAPVVRGEWRTESEVVTAEPGRRFSWSMR